MPQNDSYSKYREEFLAQVCTTDEKSSGQPSEQEGFDYFLKRLHSLEEKAQADGVSETVLYEILSYDPDSDTGNDSGSNPEVIG